MKFDQALALMKQGTPMKLPSWGGYWMWDSDKETIMIYCRAEQSDNGKSILDIRETQRVEYTLKNILSEDWIIATVDNTEILGGHVTFGFEIAFKYLKRGLKLVNKPLFGIDRYVYIDPRMGNSIFVGGDDGCKYEILLTNNMYMSNQWEFYKEPEENQNEK